MKPSNRIAAYCTAASYDISRLFQNLQLPHAAQLFRDVIHMQSKDMHGVKRDVFYFPYGVVLFWGFDAAEEQTFLDGLKTFEREALSRLELDEFQFAYGEKMAIEEDELILPKKDAPTKLALSYAIAQSVKLTVFEEAVSRTIEHSKQIPKDLSLKGKITLSRKETSKKMGELFLERNYINLHTEILDTPEFFWEHAELEPMYRKVIQYLDVTKRVDLLNRRLNLMHDLYEMLGTELNHQHSSRLEVTIIVLIFIEILLAISRDLLHLT